MNNLLFITYFWPPASKATIHWPLKVIKYLPEYNWNPSVLTTEGEDFEALDESLLSDINPNLDVIKTKVWEPFSLYRKFMGKGNGTPLVASEAMSTTPKGIKHKVSKWIRWNLFIPDARVGWYPYAVKKGMEYLQENKIDRIVTIGPPHSTHLIGSALSKKTGIPFVPVLIDPWSDIVYYKSFKRSGIATDIDKHFEKSVLRQASQVVFVTNGTREDYVNKYSFIKDKSQVLYWGYNETDFSGKKRTRTDSDEMVILHSGNIFDYQNPKNFWVTIRKRLDAGHKIKIKFTGTVSPLIREEIINNQLDSVTEYLGVVPYKDMLQEVLNADVLLVCPSEKRHIPGKLFEYLRSGNPILAFNDDNPEVKGLIENSNSGLMLSYENTGEEFFNNYDNFNPQIETSKKHDRQIIAESFSRILGKIE